MPAGYPLEAGGVGDYPIKVGSMLLTLVDPHRGFERAYTRWYERDHFYAGCMIGPWLFAGSRWVATRALKDARWMGEPSSSSSEGVVASPTDAGSYVAMYWLERGHHTDHFTDWAVPQVRQLYADGRGFAERRHIHTVLFDHLGAVYRDDDPVPVDLALDHGYDGLVIGWFDALGGRDVFRRDSLGRDRLLVAIQRNEHDLAWIWHGPAVPGEGRGLALELGRVHA